MKKIKWKFLHYSSIYCEMILFERTSFDGGEYDISDQRGGR